MELEEKRAEYTRQGLGVAALSYDSVAVLKDFATRRRITYPLLADPESRVIRAFGILNETVPKGPFYGVPWPGTFVIDAQGRVTARFFENDHRERYTAGNILLRVSPPDAAGWSETATKHLTLRYSASDRIVRGGSRVTLLLEVALPPQMHVYAPGVHKGYIPISWTLEAHPAAKAHPPLMPPSRTMHLPAIKETVPVFTGRFRVSRDVTLPQQKELLAAAGEAREFVLKGTFRYQACDDKICHMPAEVPLEWKFQIQPHDGQRAPEELRRK